VGAGLAGFLFQLLAQRLQLVGGRSWCALGRWRAAARLLGAVVFRILRSHSSVLEKKAVAGTGVHAVLKDAARPCQGRARVFS